MPVPAGQSPVQVADDDIAVYAIRAGFRGTALRTMVATCLAESSGIANNYGDLTIQTPTWGPSIGLGQVRSVKAESGKGTTRDATRLTDPQFNLNSCWTISGGGKNFTPWSMFKNGTYRLYLPRAEKAAALAEFTTRMGDATPSPHPSVDNNGIFDSIADGAGNAADKVGSIITSPLKGIEAVGAFFAALLDPKTWARILQFVGGAAALIVGLVLINRDALGDAATTIAKAAPAAAVV